MFALSLSLPLSTSLSLYLSFYLSLYLTLPATSPFSSIYICLLVFSLHLSTLCIPLYFSPYPYLSLSLSLSLSPSTYLSIGCVLHAFIFYTCMQLYLMVQYVLLHYH